MPAVEPLQMVLLVGVIVLVKLQLSVVPEQGPVLQSLVEPKTVEPPVVVGAGGIDST